MKRDENCCCRAKVFCPALIFPDNILSISFLAWIFIPISAFRLPWCYPPRLPVVLFKLNLDIPSLWPCLGLSLKEFTYCLSLSFSTVTWVPSMILKSIRLSPFPSVHPKIPNICPDLMSGPIFFDPQPYSCSQNYRPFFLLSHSNNHILKKKISSVQRLILQCRTVNVSHFLAS